MTFRAKLARFNWLSFAAMLLLIACGTLAIWSAGNARAESVFHGMWKSALATAAAMLVPYFLLAFFDYRAWLPPIAPVLYALSLVLLAAVLAVGSSVYGGRRWLWFFQPSEVSKLCVLAFLASVFGPGTLRSFRAFLLAAALVAVPTALILLEPDLGTALTLVPAAVVVLLACGVWRRGLLVALAVAGVAALAVLGAVYEAEKPGVPPERRERILDCVPLRDHQLKRVTTFLFPERDQMGAGYNLRQSLIAIGSGGATGKGLGKGESSHLRYLPPSVSMNDFIFCVWAEETGYAGALALLALFGVLCLSCVWTAFVCADGTGRVLALGVSTLLFAHVYVNIAMTVGLLPVTGLPLPFISSGRTFLVVVIAGLGLVQSVSIHREEEEQ
jgi:rod shape determining protein RodA